MPKVHTRQKRKFGRGKGTSFKFRYKGKAITAKHGPKTFASEEGAKKYAADQGIKKYSLKKVKKGKRFQVIEEKD